MLEIRFHGSGGQGVVVAAELLADAVARRGYQVQSFASYSTTRRGGRVEAHTRISEDRILVHTKVYQPDLVVIMDEELVHAGAISGVQASGGGFLAPMAGVKKGATVLINTAKSPETVLPSQDFRTVTVDANSMAAREGLTLPSGLPLINTAMLGAVAALIPFVTIEGVADTIKEKVPAPPKNIAAATAAYLAVKSQLAGELARTMERRATVAVSAERFPVYQERVSPCELACPADHGIRQTLSLLRNGDFQGALANIRAENPFPGITGRVCQHPCETKCNRNEFDAGVAINALERAATDFAERLGQASPVPKPSTGKKVAIIGSGPAGMTCAYFLALLGHGVNVFEELPVAGGIPRVGIPEYRLPKAVVDGETDHISALGVELTTSTRVGKDIAFETVRSSYDACFVAAGTQKSTKLGIQGEGLEGVLSGLDFLKAVAMHGKVEVGKKVVVIGGGNTAVDSARTARRLGATDVSLVYRRSASDMPAYANEVNAARAEGIKIVNLASPGCIHGRDSRVGGIECIRMRLAGKDADGRHRVESVADSTFRLEANTIIVAAGETLDVGFLPPGLETLGGMIRVDSLGRTSLPGVFAGGDAATLSHTVVDAIASGKRAAIGIDLYLKGNRSPDLGGVMPSESGAVSISAYLAGKTVLMPDGTVQFSDLNPAYFTPSPRARARDLPAAKRVSGFQEVRPGLTRATAAVEATRCFQCGRCNRCENCYILCPDTAIAFDEAAGAFANNHRYCRQCGICIEECPRSVLAWEGKANA